MMTFPRTFALGTVSLFIVAMPFMKPASDDLMEKKTKHAQEILRYLAKGDLKGVAAQAASLESVTIAAGFSGKSKMYTAYGDEFLNQVRGLKKKAQEENLAGTYYYFTRMTGVCFSCHEQVRGTPVVPVPEKNLQK